MARWTASALKVLVLDIGAEQVAPRTNYGALVIAALLKAAGVHVRFIQRSLNKIADEELLTLVGDFDAILFSSVLCNAEKTVSFAQKIRSRFPDKMLIVGGDGPTLMSDFFTSFFGKDVVRGPGENTILEVLGLDHIEVPKNPYQVMADDQDLLDAVQNSRLQGVATLAHNEQHIGQLATTVGCVGRCSYCHSRIMRSTVCPWLPVGSLQKGVRQMARDFGVNYIQVMDLTFNQSLVHASAVSREMGMAGILWDAMVDPGDPRLSELIPTMAECRCAKIGGGIEFLDQSREQIGKPKKEGNIDIVVRNFELLANLGVIGRAYFQIAPPNGMSDSELGALMRFLQQLEASEVAISYTTPGGLHMPWPGPGDNRNMSEWTMHWPVYLGGRTRAEWIGIRQGLANAFYGGDGYQRAKATVLRVNPNLKLGFAQHELELQSKGISLR